MGPGKVLLIFMPEHDSESESLRLGKLLAKHLGIESVVEDIGPTLEAAGCYARRDGFIREMFPAYGPGWKCKIVLNSGGGPFSFFSLVVQDPQGKQTKERLKPDAYLGIVAATNMKQRTRKQLEYYHADRLHYAVAGTPNRLEYEQGFFVKNGDGAADFKPIAHLYKSQVYQLAEYLGLPEEIRRRPPTTDTYSLVQSQEEFYFTVPYAQMDICMHALDNGVPAEVAAGTAGLTVEQTKRVFSDIVSKRKTTHSLHLPPQLVERVTWE
jgi:NAD+ synthase